MEKVNIIHHMNEFRNILSYATNIGFFFGAGTSCAFGLPDIMTLTSECKKRLSTCEQTLFGKIENSIKNMEGKKAISIEDVLNYIRQIRDITQGRTDYAFNGITGEQAAELDKKICKAVFNVIRENEEKNIKIECYVMDNGERVLPLRGAARTIGLSGNGSQALARNLNTQWIAPFLSAKLRDWLEKANRNELTTYKGIRGRAFLPFEASLFVDLCTAYVDAMHSGAVQTERQMQTAQRLYAIMTAFAKTGLVAVIDEVTGISSG